MTSRNRSHEEVTINLTPMIDVVFLLVIFFMVGAKFSESESKVNVSLPSAGQVSAISRTPDARVIEVTNTGEIVLDGQPVSRQQLTETLSSQIAVYPELKVLVRADGGSPYDRVDEVLHIIRRTGISSLDIAKRYDKVSGGRTYR